MAEQEKPRQARYHLGFTTLAPEVSVDSLPVRGRVPSWLGGTLVRTGPARFEVGADRYRHCFDGLAMLHAFGFAAGRVSYANRPLRSQAYSEAMAKGAISRGEFATDPCRTLFQRVASWFSPRITDNGCVNVADMAGAALALTESRLPVRFDARSLGTLGVREYDRSIQGPVSTAHPHYDRARGVHYSYVLDFGRQVLSEALTAAYERASSGRRVRCVTSGADRLHTFEADGSDCTCRDDHSAVHPQG
jgi:beta,beta-carotene 9',10'-dioxygenase